jgi:glycosyltransferase involved in cell wall biosynthesis
MPKPKLLLFSPAISTLIIKEAELFSSDYDVKLFDLRSLQKAGIPFRLMMQFFFLLRNIRTAKILVSRFVGYQTILPVLFGKITGKPVVCILGGLECVKFPSVKTGSYTRPFFGWITKWCLKNATHLCPVHDTLILTDYTYQDDDYPRQGYKYFVPGCDTPATVIKNGYDASRWKQTAGKKPDTFITVAHGIEKDHLFRLKGIDLINTIAGRFPDCTFTVVGGRRDLIRKPAFDNVKFIGEVANDKLHELFSTHEYYLQLSIIEGFPNALCEAMLCRCIPIGSAVGAIPEIISNDKLILKRKDLKKLEEIIMYALSLDKIKEGDRSRNRIAENYTLEKRRQQFLQLFEKLSGTGKNTSGTK